MNTEAKNQETFLTRKITKLLNYLIKHELNQIVMQSAT